MVHPTTLRTYGERAKLHSNPTAKRLLELMERKKSNLAVSVDVTTAEEVLEVVRRVGQSVVVVKTHCDIITDFSQEFIDELVRLSDELDFIIFEDRKFADIGNTVSLQYSSGTHRISSWAHLTNAHPLPGPGIIQGLETVGAPLGRALILLAEMSSKDNLFSQTYTEQAVDMARKAGKGFVVGFIAMGRVDKARSNESQSNGNGAGGDEEDFLVLTPGVGLHAGGDKMGQQYRTPREVVFESGCDIIIVGRGIYGVKGGEEAVKQEAERYRAEGWKAYEERLQRK